MKYLAGILFILLFLSNCDYMQPEEYKNEYVVEAVLIAEQLLPELNLFTTVQTDEEFSWGNTRIADAVVEIHLMGDKNKPEKIYPYTQHKRGIYIPENPEKVRASATYELHITLPEDNGHQLWASTTIPEPLEITSHLPDTVHYQSQNLPTITAKVSSNSDQNAMFMHMIEAKKPYIKNLTPYYKSQVAEDTMSTYFDFFEQVQDIVNETNYNRKSNHELFIHFLWDNFAYFGPNFITVQVLDKNMYDHIRSANAQFGGGNVGPGQLYNTITHVEGGLGVFGSMSIDSTRTHVGRP